MLEHLVEVFSPLQELLDTFKILLLELETDLFDFVVVLGLNVHLYREELVLLISFFYLHPHLENFCQLIVLRGAFNQ